ncbi:inner membrane protein YpjD [Lentibacillus sp. CBA3610]|uniref:cytochrome C assembly family protein n=1 Tax=Lentibacillus sp. CBA3610 TaxID=2518176 RepID=UPI0015958F8A|nr:cytochrome c biogenesis protein CcsA [Lentibacillus sp. CBA3610]QKY69595.1 cytochrome C assembly protein [Lentibacillus sp. CBA3610]
MTEAKWLYEIILIIYGLSLIGYFIDFIQHNRKANRTAFWLLSMVWLLQTVFLLQQVFIEKSFPVLTLYDGLSFYAWVLITLSLILNKLFRVQFMLFFINLLGFFILLLFVSTRATNHMQGQGIELVHEMLIAHITLAFVSYGFFTVSFIFSLMYLIQYRFLKNKKGFRWMWRIGDLKQLDALSFKAVTIGVPLLTISIILGVTWAYAANAEFYWFDLKTIGSILVLVVYVFYLLLRLGKGYQGKAISMYSSAAFLILLTNFLLFSNLSNFHLHY